MENWSGTMRKNFPSGSCMERCISSRYKNALFPLPDPPRISRTDMTASFLLQVKTIAFFYYIGSRAPCKAKGVPAVFPISRPGRRRST